MKKEIFQEIELPKGIEANLIEDILSVKGPEGEVKKRFNIGKLTLEIKDKKIRIGSKKATKNEKRIINTFVAHINNMISGAQKKFEYKLKVCYSHFPMTVEIKSDEATIKNLLGEKIPRKSEILKGVDVKIDKEIITVSSPDKENAGQTAANFEKATRLRKKDRRIFQDGIFIINKVGKDI